MVFFHDFWEISYPASMGGFCVYPRTGPCVSKMLQFWETFANNTPNNRWGSCIGSAHLRVPKFQIPRKVGPEPIVIIGVSQMAENKWLTGVIFHPACRGYNSVYNWLEPTLSVPLLVSNSNFACAKISSCFCCQFETFDSQTSQRPLPRKCGW